MLIDAQQLDDRSAIEAEVLVIGGGLAGLALARQLANAGLDIAVLESGGEQPDARTQSLYEGRATLGAPGNTTKDVSDFLVASRQRYLGGSGNVWGGKCAPLDPMDFQSREWIPHSGWPVTRAELQAYYDRACDLLELPKFGVRDGAIAKVREGMLSGRSTLFTPRPRCYTRYTGGGSGGTQYTEYKRATTNHTRVRVYLHANVTRIQAGADGQAVQSLTVQCLNGRAHQARGRLYILATGGIENARLLLASNDVHAGGIGNESDWLGRGFLVHTTILRNPDTSASILRAPADMAAYDITAQEKPHIVIGVSDRAQTQMRTGNFTATLAGDLRSTPASTAAVHTLVSRLSGAAVARPMAIYFMVEQTPNRDSRLTLSTESRDELGLPRVQLDLRYDDTSLDSLERMTAVLGGELGRLQAGRLQWSASRDQVVPTMSLSRHHMGATRMASSPRHGVVNAQGRLHAVDNLYVAGSSVFPTSGIANPSLTLLALGFRMGDHIAARLAKRA
jgi:choline dehydrogenase-like flavoprotein